MSASTKINISHTYYVTVHYICGACVPKLLLELRIDSNECVMCIIMFQILVQSDIAHHRRYVSDAN